MQDRLLSLFDLRDVETLSAEICVIGSGPGGGVPAVALAEMGHDVLLLEAGPAEKGGGTPLFTRDIFSDGEADLPFTGAVQLGGSSNLWAGRLAPLEPIDFEEREWVSNSGWPISAEALPYERALRLIAGFDPRMEIEKGGIPAGFGPMLGDDGIDLKQFFWVPRPFNIAHYLREALPARGGRLRVLTDSPVVELTEVAGGGRIAAALVRGAGGKPVRVEARVFVLAAGGFETARILLSSRGESGAGVGNGHDLVGRYLSTHPKADIATLTLSKRTATGHPLFMDSPTGGGRSRLGVGFGPSAQRRLALLNHYVQLSPFLEYRASRAFDRVRTSAAIKSPFIDRSSLAKGILPTLGVFAFDMIGRLAGLQGRARIFILRAFLDQYPSPENRIRLSGEINALGLPTADVTWSFSREDRASVIRFLAALDEILVAQDIGRLDYRKLLDQGDDWPLTALHSHFMGTTRMGATERQGVVDADCRVFGQSNLYVSGPSVFTTYGYANPFLTITALGLRLADHIAGRLSANFYEEHDVF